MNDYTVGRGKPPIQNRFKPGNQEWRKREAKRKERGEFSPGQELRNVLRSTIRVKRNGRIGTQSRLSAIVEKLITDALRGDVMAANDLLSFRLNAETIGDLEGLIIVFDEPGDAEL